MASFIFSALGARGHLHPPVAVAKVLRARGHTIGLYTSSHYKHIAEQLDFIYLPPKRWKDFDFTNMEQYWPELSQFEGASRSMQIYFKIFMGTALDQAHDLLTYHEQLKPDVLVTEPHAFGTQIISLKLEIPWAVIGIAIGTLALPIMGQRGVPLANQPFLYLAQGVPEFDKDKSNVLPQTHYVGVCEWDEGNEQVLTDFELPKTDLPLVFVSHGTMFAREDILEKVIAASKGQNWYLLVSTSRKISPERFAPLPENVTAVQYVPYSKVWPNAAVLMTHGSAGAVLGAIRYGIPPIVTPLEADHLANANAVANINTGIRLSADSATQEEIQQAISESISNSTYRQNAQQLQKELEKMGGAERAADLLEELALSKKPVQNPATQIPPQNN
jgi:UDP:flavonoid glycosyltransferase YjiC (YdhE family)